MHERAADEERNTPNAADAFLAASDNMESLRYLGSLPGHKGWVTAIATSSENPDMILTASRGTCLVSRVLQVRRPEHTAQTRPSSSGN